MSSVVIRDVLGEKPDEAGGHVRVGEAWRDSGMVFKAPEVELTGLEGSQAGKFFENDKEISQKSVVTLGAKDVRFKQDAAAYYYKKPKVDPNAPQPGTKAQKNAGDARQDVIKSSNTNQLMLRLAPLLNDFSADLHLDLAISNPNFSLFLRGAHVLVTNGVVDPATFIASLTAALVTIKGHDLAFDLSKSAASVKMAAMLHKAVRMRTTAEGPGAKISIDIDPAFLAQIDLRLGAVAGLIGTELFSAEGDLGMLPEGFAETDTDQVPLGLMLQAALHKKHKWLEDRAQVLESMDPAAQAGLIAMYQEVLDLSNKKLAQLDTLGAVGTAAYYVSTTYHATYQAAVTARDAAVAGLAILQDTVPEASQTSGFIQDLNGTLTIAPPNTDEVRKVDLGGMALSYRKIEAQIDTRQGAAAWGARLDIEDLGIQTDLGGGTTLDVKTDMHGHVTPDVMPAMRAGFIPFSGDALQNPMGGKINAGARLGDLSLTLSTDNVIGSAGGLGYKKK